MNIKKLEHASKIFEQIKALDASIIEIDRFAMLAANGEIKSHFTLSVEDVGKKKEEAGKVTLDEEGFLKRGGPYDDLYDLIKTGMLRPLAMGPIGYFREDKTPNDHILKQDLSENATLHILGVLLYEKRTARQMLIDQLKTYGFSI